MGTPGRLSELRRDCLIRDRHRCVITRRFDQAEAVRRFKESGDDAKDDDENLLDDGPYDLLEVAHIIPHALTKIEAGSELVSPSPFPLLFLPLPFLLLFPYQE